MRYERAVFYDERVAERIENDLESSVALSTFVDDVRFGLSEGGQGARIEIACTPRTFLEIVARVFDRDAYDSDSVGHSFLQQAGSAIARHGDVHYQLIDAQDGLGPWLAPIMPETVVLSPLGPFQLLPGEHPLPRVKRLDPTVTYSIFPDWVRPRNWRRRIRRLVKLDRSLNLAFLKSMEAGAEGYRFPVHQSYVNQAMLREASFIDWPMRYSLKPKETSDVYFGVKWLLFQSKLARIRNAAVGVMNAALQKIGNSLGFTASISPVGYQVPESYVEAARQLQSGKANTGILRQFQ